MIKVVIDTNVVVSANLVDEGPSAAIFHLAINPKIQMYFSPAVLAEYEEVLKRNAGALHTHHHCGLRFNPSGNFML